MRDGKYTFPVLLDEDEEVKLRYRLMVFPSPVVIDKRGRVTDLIGRSLNKGYAQRLRVQARQTESDFRHLLRDRRIDVRLPARNISPVGVHDQKHDLNLPLEKPDLWAFRRDIELWPAYVYCPSHKELSRAGRCFPNARKGYLPPKGFFDIVTSWSLYP